MKIRNGFVSNSSSSSFVALVPKTEWQILMANISPVIEAGIETLIDETIFCGIECIEYTYLSGNYSSFDDMNWDEIKERAKELAALKGTILTEKELQSDYIRDTVSDGTYDIRQKIQKLGNKAYKSSQEF